VGTKILVIDDSEVDRKIIGKIIQKNISDIEVIESADGIGVMEIVKSESVDMCILDLKMPNVDGIEVLSALKADRDTADVPVIVVTGMIESSVMESVLTLGAYDYFTKPFSDEAMKFSLPLKVRNAVELRKRTMSIITMSQQDDLTGLYNRRFFKNMLENMENEELVYPSTIVMCDINGLKVVNDAYGNCAGDRFLKKTAAILKKNLPDNAICARWGGDEFVAFIEGVDHIEVEKAIKKIVSASKKVNFEGLNLNLALGNDTVSSKSESVMKVLKNAEDAMFRDKILDHGSVRSNMIATILHTLNEKNPREEAHSRRVSELCEKMGIALNMSDHEINDLRIIGLLHDIGKIAIDEHILNKPSRLTDEEYSEIKRHPEIGYRILSTSKEMDRYLDVILSHHERMDGKGYPNNLSGNQIPVMARILSIIDSFDAMTCHRPYRETKSIEDAVDELIKHSDTQFDSELVKVFVHQVINV